MSTSWKVTWVASWGSLSKERTDAIEVYLADKMGGLAQGEINELVEAMALSDASGRAPTMAQLIAHLRDMRKRKRGIDTEKPYAITEIEREINQTSPHSQERWELICKAAEVETRWGHAMERYAASRGGFTLPWFVSRHKHPLAFRQEPKPAGVTSWVSCMKATSQTLDIQEQD